MQDRICITISISDHHFKQDALALSGEKKSGYHENLHGEGNPPIFLPTNGFWQIYIS